jgi:glycosyltransferase involved in cell wall biosynthesis
MPRLLLLLPQLPHDPASGAARSLRTACEFLAAAGWSVRALATTATEAAGGDGRMLLAQQGITPEEHAPNRAIYRHDRPVLTFTDRHGSQTTLLDTGGLDVFAWPERHGSQFNRLYGRALADFRPDIVFAFGGQPGDVERYRRASAAGAKIVFGLRNHGYYEARWLAELDAVLTCSEFISARYRERLGLESVALPPPLAADDVIAGEREPIFFVAVNPSVEKGGFFLARLAEEVALRRPDLPMLFIESRGSAGALVRAGLAGGFDLRRHESLMFTPATATPAEIFRGARVLLAPSVWEEPFGRVAAEALVNGVPPLVSDRGGLAEAANGGGFVLPLPAELTLETRLPVSAAGVARWVELIEKLADDDAFYAAASTRARAAGEAYLPQNLAPRYVEFFERVLANAG